MNRSILILLLATFFACNQVPETHVPGPTEIKIAKVDSLVNAWNNSSEFNGTVLVAYSDSVYTKAAGFAIQADSSPLRVNSVFYLGSLAKQFTGMAIMLLAEEGKLGLEDKAVSYMDSLPDFCSTITIRHMLNHTSGLPDYYGLGIFKPGMTNEMVYDAMKTLDSLDFEPGSSYKYSNSAYVLLSMIAGKAAGKPMGDYLKEKVFDKLNMKYSAALDEPGDQIENRVRGHNADGTENLYNAFTTGGGGIFSNVLDLYKWVRALDENKVVSADLMAESYKPAILSDSTISWYGFGWRLDEENESIYQHSGSLAGFRTYMYRDTANGTVVILLSNYTNAVADLNEEILKILND